MLNLIFHTVSDTECSRNASVDTKNVILPKTKGMEGESTKKIFNFCLNPQKPVYLNQPTENESAGRNST